MSALCAPVLVSTRFTNAESWIALCSIRARPPNPLSGAGAVGSLPYVKANTQYPLFASSGDIVCQLSVMLANSPCTSTTGRGCAALGWHDQLLEPGGAVPGWSAAAMTLAEK